MGIMSDYYLELTVSSDCPPQEHKGLENNSSTSSNFFPLVSGTVKNMNTRPRSTIPTNNQYVPAKEKINNCRKLNENEHISKELILSWK